MNKVLHFIYIIVIVVLVALLFSSKRQIKVIENRVTDTILQVKIDTITQYIPKYVTKKTVDTLYLQANDKSEVALEIEQFHFSKEGAYDAWISGYQTNLDSIKTYPRVEYRTITNNVTKEILVKKWNFFTNIGIKRFNNEYAPSLGFIAKSPRNALYGLEIGAVNGDLYYGLTYGFILK